MKKIVSAAGLSSRLCANVVVNDHHGQQRRESDDEEKPNVSPTEDVSKCPI